MRRPTRHRPRGANADPGPGRLGIPDRADEVTLADERDHALQRAIEIDHCAALAPAKQAPRRPGRNTEPGRRNPVRETAQLGEHVSANRQAITDSKVVSVADVRSVIVVPEHGGPVRGETTDRG